MTAPTGIETEPFDIASGVTITGDATDNIGVGGVRLTITNSANLTWTGSGWSSTGAAVEAALTTPNAIATGWSYTFNPPVADTYTVTATARDTGGLADPTPIGPVIFGVTGSLPDTVAPDATVTVPTNNQVLPISGVTFTGNATDNIGVAAVKVAIRNRTTLRWWNGSSWVTATTWLPGAILSSPGTPVTGWSFSWTPPATGLYAVTVRAEDAVTPVPNYDLTRPWVNFSVS